MVGFKRYLAGAILFLGALAVLIPFLHSVGSSAGDRSATVAAPARFVIATDPATPENETASRRPQPGNLHLVADH